MIKIDTALPPKFTQYEYDGQVNFDSVRADLMRRKIGEAIWGCETQDDVRELIDAHQTEISAMERDQPLIAEQLKQELEDTLLWTAGT